MQIVSGISVGQRRQKREYVSAQSSRSRLGDETAGIVDAFKVLCPQPGCSWKSTAYYNFLIVNEHGYFPAFHSIGPSTGQRLLLSKHFHSLQQNRDLFLNGAFSTSCKQPVLNRNRHISPRTAISSLQKRGEC